MPYINYCWARLAHDGRKCETKTPPSKVFCQEHYDEYLALKSTYERATKEAEALEILLVEIGIKAVQQNEVDRDPDEVRADGIIVAKYIERLRSAIRGRQEAEKRFSLAGKPSHCITGSTAHGLEPYS